MAALALALSSLLGLSHIVDAEAAPQPRRITESAFLLSGWDEDCQSACLRVFDLGCAGPASLRDGCQPQSDWQYENVWRALGGDCQQQLGSAADGQARIARGDLKPWPPSRPVHVLRPAGARRPTRGLLCAGVPH